VSLAEKLLEELSKNPELAEKLRKFFEHILLNEILKEQKELRKDFLILVEESNKRFIAIENVLVKLREDFNKSQEENNKRFLALQSEIVKLREDFNKAQEDNNKRFLALESDLFKLREDFNRAQEENNKRFLALQSEIVKLREDFNKAQEDNNKRFLAIEGGLTKLREDFNRVQEENSKRFLSIESEIAKLREDFNAMLKEIASIKINLVRLEKRLDETAERLTMMIFSGFSKLSRFAGISFEEFARHFLEGYLRRTGILPKGVRLKKGFINGEEINIFCEDPPIVGEVTAYAGSKEEAEKLLRKVKLFKEKYGVEPKKFLIILSVSKKVYREIKKISMENGIELIVGKRVA
jgi:lipase chaperone LimK